MVSVYSKALDKSIKINRYIGKFESSPKLPTVVFIGGIHGNEPSGVFALSTVVRHIVQNNISLKGNMYALAGNLCALPKGKRFCEVDLNRIWVKSELQKAKNISSLNGKARQEDLQLNELQNEISAIIERSQGDLYFIDLHTTSSKSCPFIPINDTMANRRFARKFPVPTVLGIEEFLDGPLLSYINELNHIAIGFEAGQHDEKVSIEHHIAFVSLVLLYTGLINKIDFPDYKHYAQKLEQAGKRYRGIYEIRSRFEIQHNHSFTMLSGFQSFQKIKKGQNLAEYEGQIIKASQNGRIFMPLYQNQGEDGFFIIRKIPLFWLKISSLLRKIRFDNFLLILPGISRDVSNSKTLVVNTRVARFYGKEIFHLLGYRMKTKIQNVMKFTRRESL